ncbi:hypothetical protein EKD04_023210 [Chloroflexales bacterium ZM16-3]|nr:hypothetical protein [Chloroflexales bacterium ZM16-3]
MEPLTIRLSQEEVLFIIGAVHANNIPGMGSLAAIVTDEAMLATLRDAGGRALIARELLVPQDDGLSLDKGLYAIGLACTRPDQLVSLAITKAGGPTRQSFYYRVPEVAVLHQPDDLGTHSFSLSLASDMGAGAASAAPAALPDSSSDQGGTWHLPQAALAAAEDQARGGGAAAAALLSAGVDAPAAALLAQTLAAPDLNMVLQLVAQLQPTVTQTLLRLIAGAGGSWLVIGESLTDDTLEVRQVTRDMAAAMISESFKQFHASWQA